MIHRLHELLKDKGDLAVSITLWPIEEVDLWIRDQSDPYETPKTVFTANNERLDDVILEAISWVETQ